MTPEIDLPEPSGPNWGMLLLLAASTLIFGLAAFGAFTLGRILGKLWG